jgi:glycosyltransferase involved in cell wall biosynthesis
MVKKKNVCIVGANGLPANYGGFETLTYYLVDNLSEELDITVFCSKTSKEKRLAEFNSARLMYFPFKANGWQSMIYDFISICYGLVKYDNLIILGFSGAFAFPLNIFFRKNIIFNIGGIEWKKVRGSAFTSTLEIKLKKWMEKLCVRNSNSVIIDNDSFEEYLIKEYNIKPVLAEYGGNHAIFSQINHAILNEYPFLNKSYDLSVSRAQFDMNIHMLIDAYKLVPKRTLVVVSNWNISDYGKNLYKTNINKYPNIILLNAIYDQSKLNVIRSNCELYIHSHSLCGTAPSLVEAMSLNLPVIAYDVPTNRSTTENKTMYFKNESDLIELLKKITHSKLQEIRALMLEIAIKRYTWERIARLYLSCIK